MTESKPTKYSTIMYNLMYMLHSGDTIAFSWYVYVENILSTTNFKDLWDNQSKYDTKKYFKNDIFKVLDSNTHIEWCQDLLSSPKCFNYRIFKVTPQFESYITDSRLSNLKKLPYASFDVVA